MNRDEHIKWCKERAIKEMEYYKQPSKAMVSMMSDLRKHPETNSDTLVTLCMMQLLINQDITEQQVIKFLDGFH